MLVIPDEEKISDYDWTTKRGRSAPVIMSGEYVQMQRRGKPTRLPSVCIEGRVVITSGKWVKIAAVMDEELVEGETVPVPELFLSRLKDTELKADIFTFVQKLPDIVPKHKYHLEWDDAAVIPITSFSDWWGKRVKYDVRNAVKKAARLGVIVKVAQFDDTFVEGIVGIYNESPIRQGAPFLHYQKSFDTVRRENATYLDRSTFIGAYYNDELIGFIKMVHVGTIATTMQVVGQKKQFNKKPMNALIAKAVEICEMKGVSHLVYGSYIYHDLNSSLTEFKRRNGFEQVLLPRYYIPLTLKGKIALKLNLHHRLVDHVPVPVLAQLRKLRSLWHGRRLQVAKKSL